MVFKIRNLSIVLGIVFLSVSIHFLISIFAPEIKVDTTSPPLPKIWSVEWAKFDDFGVEARIDACGLMRIRPVSNNIANLNLAEDNLLDFVEIVYFFMRYPSFDAGFTAEDMYFFLEELDLLDSYLSIIAYKLEST